MLHAHASVKLTSLCYTFIISLTYTFTTSLAPVLYAGDVRISRCSIGSSHFSNQLTQRQQMEANSSSYHQDPYSPHPEADLVVPQEIVTRVRLILEQTALPLLILYMISSIVFFT